jgi:hypothetical protein
MAILIDRDTLRYEKNPKRQFQLKCCSIYVQSGWSVFQKYTLNVFPDHPLPNTLIYGRLQFDVLFGA